jgi:hypothetical protein
VGVPTALSSASRRPADVLTKLVQIFGNKDRFVQEYERLLADRLLALSDYDTDNEVRGGALALALDSGGRPVAMAAGGSKGIVVRFDPRVHC